MKTNDGKLKEKMQAAAKGVAKLTGGVKYAAVFGSPGTRVRFVGFARIFWPYLLVVFAAGWLLHCLWPIKIEPFVLAAAALALALVSVTAFGASERRFASYLKGAKGEEITARELALLETGWDVFHGVENNTAEASSGGRDFDHIVVGPDSVFLVETKNWDGVIRVENGTLKLNGIPVKRSPIVQVRRGARGLLRMLEDALPANFDIMKIVCFASNNLEGEEANIDDVFFCNSRALRSAILESPPGTLDAIRRRLIIENLTKHAL